MESIIIASVLLIIVVIILRKIVKDRKKTKDFRCDGDCGHCPYSRR